MILRGAGMLALAIGVVALAACDRAVRTAASPAASPAAPAPAAPSVTAPVLLTASDVDARLSAEWAKAGVAPTTPASDAVWLRRVWVDTAGTIPPPERVRLFLVDRSPDKRARAVEELLASPLWAEHWAAYWDGVLMGRAAPHPDVDRAAFHAWLHGEFSRGAPWNEVATLLLTATGRNSAGGPRRPGGTTAAGATAKTPIDDAPDDDAAVHGAVNWTLAYRDTPQDLAGAASRTLLGVQIQCAQCHDHKTEAWKQKDFQRFAAAFTRTRPEPLDRGRAMGAIRRVDLVDLDRPAPRFAKTMTDFAAIATAEPTALDGTRLGGGRGVRVALARWMTSPDNPWFARAFVNRMWGHFLGRGFVDPVDDLRVSNPPAAPALLDALAADFVASGYDVKHLVRVITRTRAYAASAAPLDDATAKADPEAKLWERFRMTPLGADELWNALVAATRLDAIVQASFQGSASLDLAVLRSRVRQRYDFLFDVDEESDEGDYDGTIAQGLALLNGSVVASGATTLPGGALAAVLAMPGDDAAKIEALYLRTFSRLPDADETARWTAFVRDAVADVPAARDGGPPAPARPVAAKGASDPFFRVEARAHAQPGRRTGPRERAYEDMLWTLLNASEFVFNH